jgi:transcriptional regulator with GAF, ATPase, and Fis domain
MLRAFLFTKNPSNSMVSDPVTEVEHGTEIIRLDENTHLSRRRCKLVVTRGPDVGRSLELGAQQIKIGKMQDNDLVLTDKTVSRYHVEIYQVPNGSYAVRDLKSTNGTLLDNARIKEAYLNPGATITIGNSDIKFTLYDEKMQIPPSRSEHFGDMVGRNQKMRKIFGVLEKVGPQDVTIIIEGETGTGKELVARGIHLHSARKDKPFIVVDCGAVQSNLIESELFGHEKGSFTGAIASRQGAFELAHNGTIFLDELGELPLELQPKLLRVLEQREIKRVGGSKTLKVDVRIIAATNRNLEEEVKKGNFRQDLFFRLSVVRVWLPPLRERRDDVPLIVKKFLEDKTGVGIDNEAMRVLMNYNWPGNIRELKNAIERASSFCENKTIRVSDLPIQIQEGIDGSPPVHYASDGSGKEAQFIAATSTNLPFKDAKEELLNKFERDYLVELLKRNNLNISQAAREAKLDRKHIRNLMKKYKLNITDL